METIEKWERGYQIVDSTDCSDTVGFDFWYPEMTEKAKDSKKIKYLEIGLVHVRASDGMRIHYDFDRDGFVIEQSYFKYEKRISETTGGEYFEEIRIWEETSFIQSWALDCKGEDPSWTEDFS